MEERNVRALSRSFKQRWTTGVNSDNLEHSVFLVAKSTKCSPRRLIKLHSSCCLACANRNIVYSILDNPFTFFLLSHALISGTDRDQIATGILPLKPKMVDHKMDRQTASESWISSKGTLIAQAEFWRGSGESDKGDLIFILEIFGY